ncbi:uncharacterized protein VTP21DRAFT_7957 [Calcarisporiella thermophila]|uniref:uncharacterized protein n=1 Tax=Calcarisporiella thermophila TaxID=911321 RepID=UPI0037421BA1
MREKLDFNAALQFGDLFILLWKATRLVDSEIGISDTYAKVIAVKMTDLVDVLEVKEEVEEGIWDKYVIDCNSNMKPR